jgi:formylmethanofuran dehydrogenase subunit C
MITLKPKFESAIPVEAGCISPDVFGGKPAEEVGELPLLWGNKKKKLSDLFYIRSGKGTGIVIDGDVPNAKHIGAGMAKGSISIKGSAGMHVGHGMEGGRISIAGNAGDWLGAEMRGGLISVKGSVGDLAGSAYRGSKRGMTGGTIIIHGNAGTEVGELLAGGNIGVKGSVGSFVGTLMEGGLIACLDGIGERPGAGMIRGTILAMKSPRMLPTFRFTRAYNPKLLKPRLEELKAGGFPVGRKHIEGLYDRYEGDLAADGKGRIIVWKQASG